MKSITITILLIILTMLHVHAQRPVKERNNPFDLGPAYTHSNITSFPTKSSFGVLGSFRFGEHVSSFFPLTFGDGYAHTSLSTIFAPIGIITSRTNDGFESFGGLIATFFAMATAVERLGFHIRLSQQVELIPYYSLLGLHFYGEEVYSSASAGTMLRCYLPRGWYANGYAEYNRFYASPNPTGIITGFCIGYQFK